MVDYRKRCFFCSEEIITKKEGDKEHIISDSLLQRLNIKTETISGQGVFTYSRVKVPAHKKCNSTYGSLYEDMILKLLDSPEDLYQEFKLNMQSINWQYGPSSDKLSIIKTWLFKVYYGLFYNDLLKVKNLAVRAIYENIINEYNFKLVQQSYKRNNGFVIPSSLYIFKTNKKDFDLKTYINPQAILIRIEGFIYVLAIGDGYLCKDYLKHETLNQLQYHIFQYEKNDCNFPSQLLAFAEIIALRKAIPKSPRFFIFENEIINLSFSSHVKNPEKFYEIDEDLLHHYKEEIFKEYNIFFE